MQAMLHAAVSATISSLLTSCAQGVTAGESRSTRVVGQPPGGETNDPGVT